MGAPRGNLFAVGNTGGRPPRYDSPEELQKKVAEYLDWEDECRNRDAKGVGKGLYTISGCALFLGFATRDSFYDLEKREDFSYTMKRFRLFMTHWNEQKLYYMGTFAGSQLWLKNFGGYKDESTVNENFTNLTADFGTTIPTTHESTKDSSVDK